MHKPTDKRKMIIDYNRWKTAADTLDRVCAKDTKNGGQQYFMHCS